MATVNKILSFVLTDLATSFHNALAAPHTSSQWTAQVAQLSELIVFACFQCLDVVSAVRARSLFPHLATASSSSSSSAVETDSGALSLLATLATSLLALLDHSQWPWFETCDDAIKLRSKLAIATVFFRLQRPHHGNFSALWRRVLLDMVQRCLSLVCW